MLGDRSRFQPWKNSDSQKTQKTLMLQNALQDILTGCVTSIFFHLLARNTTIQKMEYKAKQPVLQKQFNNIKTWIKAILHTKIHSSFDGSPHLWSDQPSWS
jgi:hypothetical protein